MILSMGASISIAAAVFPDVDCSLSPGDDGRHPVLRRLDRRHRRSHGGAERKPRLQTHGDAVCQLFEVVPAKGCHPVGKAYVRRGKTT